MTNLSVSFPAEARERLDEMQRMAGVTTDDALVRNAIVLYECVLQEVLVGGTLMLQEAHGGLRPVTVPGGPRL